MQCFSIWSLHTLVQIFDTIFSGKRFEYGEQPCCLMCEFFLSPKKVVNKKKWKMYEKTETKKFDLSQSHNRNRGIC